MSDVEVLVQVGGHFVSQSLLGVLAPGQHVNIPNEWSLGRFPQDRSFDSEVLASPAGIAQRNLALWFHQAVPRRRSTLT